MTKNNFEAAVHQAAHHQERMRYIQRWLHKFLDVDSLNTRRREYNKSHSHDLDFKSLLPVTLMVVVVDAYHNTDDFGDDPVGWVLDIHAQNLVDPGLLERVGFKQRISYLEGDGTRYKVSAIDPSLINDLTSVYEARAFRKAVQT